MKKALIISFFVLSTLIVVFVALEPVLRYYLEQNYHVKIKSIEVEFAGGLTLSDIFYFDQNNELEIESARVHFKWSDIIFKREGSRHINEISIHNIHTNNLDYSERLELDIKEIKLQKIELSNNYFADSLTIDGLRIYSGQLEQIEHQTDSLDVEQNETNLPEIGVKNFALLNTDITYNTDSVDYKINDLNIALNNLNTVSFYDLHLDTLSVTLQDTINFHASADSFGTKGFEEYHGSTLSFKLPGVDLKINDFTIDSTQTFPIVIDLDRLTVERTLVDTWFPSMAVNLDKFPELEGVSIKGLFKLKNTLVNVERSSLKINDIDMVQVAGHIDVGKKQSIDLILYNKLISAESISLFYNNDQFRMPDIDSFKVYLEGSIENLKSSGYINTTAIELNFLASYINEKLIDSQLKFKTSELNEWINDIPVPLGRFEGKLTARADNLTSDTPLINGDLFITGKIGEEFIDSIILKYDNSNRIDSVKLEIDDNLGSVNIKAAIAEENEVSFSQVIDISQIPTWIQKKPAVDRFFISSLNTINFDNDSLNVFAVFDEILIESLGKEYSLNNIKVELNQGLEVSALMMSFNEGQIISAEVSNNLDLSQINKIDQSINNLYINLWTDSLQLNYDTLNLRLKADTFLLSKENNLWAMIADVPILKWGELQLQNIRSSLRGDLLTSPLKFSIDKIIQGDINIDSLKVIMTKENKDYLVNLAARHPEFPEPLFIPLKLRNNTDNYQIAFNEKKEITLPYLKLKSQPGDSIILNEDLSLRGGNINLVPTGKDRENLQGVYASFTKDEVKASIYNLNLENIASITGIDSLLNLKGLMNTDIQLDLNSNELTGMMVLDSVDLSISDPAIDLFINNDTITLEENTLTLENFYVVDINRDSLQINGEVKQVLENPIFDLNLSTQKFQILRSENREKVYSGDLVFESSVDVEGDLDYLSISGEMNVLPDANIIYNFSRDEAGAVHGTNAVIFTEFDSTANRKPKNKGLNTVIDWDLDLSFKDISTEIILDDIKQEFVKVLLNGDLELRNGNDGIPDVFGSISSSEGRAFYKAPSIPQLNLIVEKMNLSWSGDAFDPLLNFSGYETFKIDPSNLNEQFSSYGVENFLVYLKVENANLDELELGFDLTSQNSAIQGYLEGLPSQTRSEFATNLLLFGSFEFMGSEKAYGYSMLASKLNEISHRNIKNADIYFSADKSEEDQASTRTDLNYNINKKFLHNKLSVSFSGGLTVDADSQDSNNGNSHLVDNVVVNYILKEEPTFTLKAERKLSDNGLDQDVPQTSFGIHFRKRFRRLKQK